MNAEAQTISHLTRQGERERWKKEAADFSSLVLCVVISAQRKNPPIRRRCSFSRRSLRNRSSSSSSSSVYVCMALFLTWFAW